MTDRRRVAAGVVAITLIGLRLTDGGALAQVAGPGIDERTRAAFGTAAPELRQRSQDQDLERAGRAVADRLGVEFLGVEAIEIEGRRLVSVRVMEPGGTANTAFLVQTLVVDPASGELLGVFPGANTRRSDFPGSAGAVPEAAAGPVSGDESGGD